MLRSGAIRFGFLIATGSVLVAACSSDSSTNDTGDAAAGGSTSSGGSASTGGAKSTGGSGGSLPDASDEDGATSTGGRDGSAPDASDLDASTSSGGTSSGGTSSGGTSGSGGATGSGGTASVKTCGTAPYARLWVGGSTLLDHPTGAITVSGTTACSGDLLSLTPKKPASQPGKTGIDAQFLDVPDKVPVYLRATQVGSLPLLTLEVLPDKDSIVSQAFKYAALVNAGMVATDSGLDALDPSWNTATRAMVLLQVAPLTGATGACAAQTGITITVNKHTEATGANGVRSAIRN